MNDKNIAKVFTRTVERLLTNDSNDKMQYCRSHGESMPSGEVLKEVVKLVRAGIFPGYFGAFMNFCASR